jgi:hypothetical protein
MKNLLLCCSLIVGLLSACQENVDKKLSEQKSQELAAKQDQDKEAVKTPTEVPATKPKSTVEKKESVEKKVEVKLVDAGKGSKQKLRYKFSVDNKEVFEMIMKMTIGIEVGDMKQPPITSPDIKMHMSVEPKNLFDSGDLRYEFKVTKADVVEGTGEGAIATQMQAEIGKMVGMSGWAEVTSRGVTKKADIKASSAMNSGAMELMENMRTQLEQVAMPFPEEAVGIGAKWDVITPIKTEAFSFTQKASYTLTKREGDKITMEVKLKHAAEPQDITMKKLPPGTKARLDSYNASGSGNVELDLNRIVPKSDVEAKTDIAMSVDYQGKKNVFKTHMQMEISIDSK